MFLDLKISILYSQKLEEYLSNSVIIIPERKRVNGKEYRSYTSKKVSRDRTLTVVIVTYFDDILYHATIVGKRIRYPVGKIKTFKVMIKKLMNINSQLCKPVTQL